MALSRLRALAETDLTRRTYELLRTRLMSGDLASGQRLRLDLLASQLKVSRTPIREALNQLADEGLIEIRPRRGTFVAQVDRRTVDELYQLRLMIDTFVGDVVARSITNAQIRRLGRLLQRLEAQVRGDAYLDYAEYLHADRALHSAIVGLVGNRRLNALYDEIILPLWLVRAQQEAGLAQDRDAAASLEAHRAILRALESRDPGRVAHAMAAHIQFARVRLHAWLDDEDRRRDALEAPRRTRRGAGAVDLLQDDAVKG